MQTIRNNENGCHQAMPSLVKHKNFKILFRKKLLYKNSEKRNT